MSKISILTALTILACKGKDKDDDTSGIYEDADGDGFTSDVDCDDDNEEVFPDADETCDGIDNDCDEAIDDEDDDLVGGTPYYVDLDDDGYGDPDSLVEACDAPNNTVTRAGDCDDKVAQVNPNGVEICDGIDNDCNDLVDDESVDANEYYVDSDGDGYGDDKKKTVGACEVPKGYAEEAGDCDDTDKAFNPAAEEKDCLDPNDYNCDGSVGYEDIDGDKVAACEGDCDDDDPNRSPLLLEVCDKADLDENCNYLSDADDPDLSDGFDVYRDADGDTFGTATITSYVCEVPSGYVEDNTDCDDVDRNVYPDAKEICDGKDSDCDGEIPGEEIDGDKDGYFECEGDCDDGASDVNPGADEVCDASNTDEDCSGAAEDNAVDAVDYYYDGDNDGFGGGLNNEYCPGDEPTRYYAASDDCDDTDRDTYPGATELCDGVLNDCDGTLNEDWEIDNDGDSYAECEGDCDDTDPKLFKNSTTYYLDNDGDTYGDVAEQVQSCDAPTGYVANSEDCNDTDKAVNPGADEVCNGDDDDCDGPIDEDAVDSITYYYDGDGDAYGDTSTSTARCNAPSDYVVADGDCDDTEPLVNPGETEVCSDGLDNDCVDGELYCEVTTADAGVVIIGEQAFDAVGSSFAGGMDLGSATGAQDGIDDLIIGGPQADAVAGSGNEEGAAYVVWGPLTSSATPYRLDGVDLDQHKIYGANNSSNLGKQVEIIESFIGDGTDTRPELVVTAPNDSWTTQSLDGVVYVISGDAVGGTGSDAADSFANTVVFNGQASYDYLGDGFSTAGDVDDDGEVDLLMGAPGRNGGGTNNTGAVYLVMGPMTVGDYAVNAVADAIIYGDGASDLLGGYMSSADIDGDGNSDILIGSAVDDSNGSNSGAAYVISGATASGLNTSVSSAADAAILGEAANDLLGPAIAGIEDVDGDGRDDLLVGATGNSPSTGLDAGAAYLVLGDAKLSTLDADVDSIAYATFIGDTTGDGAGSSVDGGHDFDNDGNSDYIIGASGYGSSDAGASYIVFGPVSGTVELTLGAAGADGRVVGDSANENIGDVNGFGGRLTVAEPDSMVTASTKDDTGGTDAGGVFIAFDL